MPRRKGNLMKAERIEFDSLRAVREYYLPQRVETTRLENPDNLGGTGLIKVLLKQVQESLGR